VNGASEIPATIENFSRLQVSKEITADDIAAYLDARDDFDLELFALQSLRDHGWEAHHGGTYDDPVTDKPRQYDIWARAVFPLYCYMLLAVECKSLTVEFPLVLSRVSRDEVDANHDLIKNWNRQEIGDTASIIINSAASRAQLYAAGAKVGKATNQMGWQDNGKKLTASDKDTYDKWSQCLAAATHLVRTAATAQRGPSDGQPSYTFVMPVLVVSDETLWVVDYGENNKRSRPAKADSALLYVDRHLDVETRTGQKVRYHLSYVHIYTRKGFVNLLKELGEPSGNRLRELIYGWAIRQHAGQC
jgi:hypothetical protein